jgi:hypothetical protein
MTNNLPLKLNPITVPVQDFVDALRFYDGMPYGEVTRIDGIRAWDGRPIGRCNCTGLILLALIRVKLLPADFDANISQLAAGIPRARYFWNLVHNNGTQVADAKPGRIVLQRWSDVDRSLVEPHHVSVFTSLSPVPYGSFIQCLDRRSGGQGKVAEVPLDEMETGRFDQIWQCANIGEAV